MITLQLTRDEAHKLETYLLISTKYRTGEADTLNELYLRLKEEGETEQVVLDKLKDNAEFWQQQCVAMDSIQQRLLQCLTTPRKTGREENNESR